MHGSLPRQDDVPRSRLNLVDLGVLTLPVVLTLLAFGFAYLSVVFVQVWWAARQWLNMHDLPQVSPKQHKWGSAPLDRSTWTSLWRPYWLAKRRFSEWLPLAPSRKALAKL